MAVSSDEPPPSPMTPSAPAALAAAAAAVAAVHRLASEPHTAAVRIRVFPKLDAAAEDREFVRTSGIVIAAGRLPTGLTGLAEGYEVRLRYRINGTST